MTHLVFLNQYYPPDVAPTGVMLEGVVRQLVRDGHAVTVLCAAGGYGGQGGGMSADAVEEKRAAHGTAPRAAVIRIGATRFGRGTMVGKLLDYASFYGGVIWRLGMMNPRPTRVVALTTPPYLSVVARVMSKLRGADHAHWVMDLYPDVMVAHGMLRERSWLARWLAGLARWGFGGRRCAAVLTLGPDMAERVGRYLSTTKPPRAEWVPLWGGELARSEDPGARTVDDADAVAVLRKARGWGDDELVVMYSGNMGLGHRFGEILAAALELKDKPVRWVFFGDGRRRGEVADFMRAHPECRLELHPYAPAEMLTEHLRSADVHLASLDPAWTGTMVPSKLQGIFAAARPVVFIGSADSSIGRWVTESGGGWVVPPGDGPGLEAALAEASQPELRASRGRAARNFALRHFNESLNIPRVAAVLGEADS
jgi:hypothetical protein